MQKYLSTQPYKGARDFYPEDMRIRNYIFETWKKVCESYAYEPYDGPLLEPFELYAAKTGEEIVNEQLYSFEDKGQRKVAIRPEMTPTVARMVASKYKELIKPIRWYSMPNLWRYEKPQKGRLREHFQLNVDIFGAGTVMSDFEIIKIGISIMKEFGATEEMFQVRVNNRRFMDSFFDSLNILPNQKYNLTKILNRIDKMSRDEFNSKLIDEVKLNSEQIEAINTLLNFPNEILYKEYKNSNTGATELVELTELAANLKLDKIIRFDPKIMRGFDYYTGNIFEFFDLNESNNRSILGGGRYDDLISMFTNDILPATGFGMGDVTLKDFLITWGLLPNLKQKIDYIVVEMSSSKNLNKAISIANQLISEGLRKKGFTVLNWVSPSDKLDKQLSFANKHGITYAIIIGDNEISEGKCNIKNLSTGEQQTILIESMLKI